MWLILSLKNSFVKYSFKMCCYSEYFMIGLNAICIYEKAGF